MKIEFLKSEGSSSLILIYAGWSTRPELFADVYRKGWDVAVAYDFTDISLDTTFLNKYTTIMLFAWSLGVRAAVLTLPSSVITAAYAINGTLAPVDDIEGIPRDIYYGTAQNLNERNLIKFRKRMAGDSETFRRFFSAAFSDDEIDSLRNQLYKIADFQGPLAELPWRKAYISGADRIFPSENMINHWKNRCVNIEYLENASHYLPIENIIDREIPDTEVIANKFSDSFFTYDDNAKAQFIIASNLSELLKSLPIHKNPNILEIGPGTGFLTRKYANYLKPEHIDFVDIADIPHMGVTSEENYYREDAEQWIRLADSQSYDYVLSASAIQWFINMPEFIRQSHRVLKPGGYLAISTFISGNLKELDAFRPSPINYLEKGEYIDLLSEKFEIIHCSEEKIKLEFDSPRQLLMHLKLTGVGGSAKSDTPLRLSALRDTHTLTYRPLYILARKSL